MKQTDKQTQIFDNPLGYAPVIKLIAKYAIPSILSMLVTAAYNITDQIFIGNVVGMLGNAATNVAFPTVTLTTAFAQMAGIGTRLILIFIWEKSRRMKQSGSSERV